MIIIKILASPFMLFVGFIGVIFVTLGWIVDKDCNGISVAKTFRQNP